MGWRYFMGRCFVTYFLHFYYIFIHTPPTTCYNSREKKILKGAIKMKKSRKQVRCLALLLLLAMAFAALSGCGGGGDAIIGRWVSEFDDWGRMGIFDFQSDGTFIVLTDTDDGHPPTADFTGTWTRSGEFLILQQEDNRSNIQTFEYLLFGNTLTLTAGGESMTFTRMRN